MAESDQGTAVAPPPQEQQAPQPQQAAKPSKSKPRRQPPYHVVLHDDDDHTYEYVIEMLMKLFGYDVTKAFLMAAEVDLTGRVIVDTTTKERAEFKRDQIHAYGKDVRLERCQGSMTASIEPAEDGD